jgi:hypothetical protein
LLKHLPNETNKFLGKTNAGEIQCTHSGSEFKSKPSYIYHVVNCLPEDVKASANAKAGLCI